MKLKAMTPAHRPLFVCGYPLKNLLGYLLGKVISTSVEVKTCQKATFRIEKYQFKNFFRKYFQFLPLISDFFISLQSDYDSLKVDYPG